MTVLTIFSVQYTCSVGNSYSSCISHVRYNIFYFSPLFFSLITIKYARLGRCASNVRFRGSISLSSLLFHFSSSFFLSFFLFFNCCGISVGELSSFVCFFLFFFFCLKAGKFGKSLNVRQRTWNDCVRVNQTRRFLRLRVSLLHRAIR